MIKFEKYHGAEPGNKLLEHSRWISERYERMNEQLLTLSSTFIGFLAVELALFAQIKPTSFPEKPLLNRFMIICGILVVSSIISFFIALISKRFELPILNDFQIALSLKSKELEVEPLRLMVSSEKSNPNIQDSFEIENRHLNKFYKPGLYLAGGAQLGVLALLIYLWA